VTVVAIEAPCPEDIAILHPALAETYWSPGIPRAVVERACANSYCAIARDAELRLIGFARVVSDGATFAWLCDVIVLPEHRGQGIARALVAELTALPDLAGLRRWMLATRDAHAVYAPFGFAPLAAPDRWMERRVAAPYGRATG